MRFFAVLPSGTLMNMRPGPTDPSPLRMATNSLTVSAW